MASMLLTPSSDDSSAFSGEFTLKTVGSAKLLGAFNESNVEWKTNEVSKIEKGQTIYVRLGSFFLHL